MRGLRTLALAFILLPSLAWGQSAILQGGPWSAGHVPMYSGPGGGTPVVSDGGSAAGGNPGATLSEIGITARGTGTAPYAAQGTGPYGTIFCNYDAPKTNATGYHYFCLSPNAQGGGLIAYGAGGGAANLPLNFMVNGTTYAFPFTTSGAVGPATTTVGNLAVWNNTTGTLLAEASQVTLAQLPTASAGSLLGSVAGGVPSWLTSLPTGFIIPIATTTFTGQLGVANGGTGDATFTANGVVYGNGTGPLGVTALGAANTVLTGTGSAPAFSQQPSLGTNGGTLGKVTLNGSTSGSVAIQPAAAAGTGTLFQLPASNGSNGQVLQTDGTGVTSWAAQSSTLANSSLAFSVPVNLGISVVASANALTVSVLGNNGSAPSSTNQVLVSYRDTTTASGLPTVVSQQAALSITVAAGNTMGCTSAVACRLWIIMMNNAGTNALCLFNASSSTQIFPINEGALQASAAGTTGGSSTNVYYCTASSISNKAIRIVGYLEATEATAGTWATSPSLVQLFSPGSKKPGDVVQTIVASTTTAATTTSATFAAFSGAVAPAIIPTSAVNLIRATLQGAIGTSSASVNGVVQIVRGTTTIGVPMGTNGTVGYNPGFALVLDNPGVATSTTYSYQGKTSGGTLSFPPASTGVYMELQEIMGALPEPANDNGTNEIRMVG